MIRDALKEYKKSVEKNPEILKVNVFNTGVWIDNKDAKLGACVVFENIINGIQSFIDQERKPGGR